MQLTMVRWTGRGSSATYDFETSGVILTQEFDAGWETTTKSGSVHLQSMLEIYDVPV